ncbi:MAG: hypothetical protein ACPLTR_10550 [Thermacetogeniaceae bacterium]
MTLRLVLDGAKKKEARWITCYFCEKPGVRIHIAPDGEGGWEVLPSCGSCDPGGYWMPLKDFAERPLEWLGALAEVNPAQALALLRWASSRVQVIERAARGEDVGMTREALLEWARS